MSFGGAAVALQAAGRLQESISWLSWAMGEEAEQVSTGGGTGSCGANNG